jgi:hypothetical protein
MTVETRFLTHRGFNALAESIIGLFKTEVMVRGVISRLSNSPH